ncbi:sporulation protein [Rossellomorea marisflavi]|jgi:sporulation-control protein|uniref:Sporulation protein n=1 Tax=Rossellomorea marisflavi TaxID=189381 RepID=A0A5D4RZV7_9BACI|nr:sporulation protein [Rossellomorea marisflavi]MDW4527044.1 sporulation protein [Rossellomorea marisflavi]TYS56490.1 sporulation protein [Rossellomorea marisflavi]WJV20639.1 sporulation protein [Rossellomorea marisflavi]
MSFFNKVLATIGIGAATVDTVLEKSHYVAGERIQGMIGIKGGSTQQEVDAIYLTLHTTYIRESDDKKFTDQAIIQKIEVAEPFIIKENERKEIPFAFDLSYETPVTYGNTKVWVSTGMDIKNSIDPKDKDYIEIAPHPLKESVLSAIQELGFRTRKVECEQAPKRLRRHFPFIQEFEFVPMSGAYAGKLDELEVIFNEQSKDRVEILLEVDRRARGLGGFLAEALDMDESIVTLNVDASDAPDLKRIIQKAIDRVCS